MKQNEFLNRIEKFMRTNKGKVSAGIVAVLAVIAICNSTVNATPSQTYQQTNPTTEYSQQYDDPNTDYESDADDSQTWEEKLDSKIDKGVDWLTEKKNQLKDWWNSDNEENLTVLENRLSTPTTFNEDAYPNFYRVVGTAVINESEIQDYGEIEYQTDRNGYPIQARARLTSKNLADGDSERSDLSGIRPKGWPSNNEQTTITFADGSTYSGYFWNRSHLIAHMLGGNSKFENLITGTRAQNVGKNDGKGGMQYCEYLAADYIENHPNGYVDYIVTPIYANYAGAGDIIASSVIVDIKSDDGSIDYEIEVFNAMPGYTINYATGEATPNN